PLRSRIEKEPSKADELMKSVSEKLSEAMSHKELVGASTGKETLPPGINGRHAYAVLGYDSSSRVVHLWNPHGNTFHPKGLPGLQNGYPTKAGQFDMPLSDFVRVFNGLALERTSVASAEEPKKKTLGRK